MIVKDKTARPTQDRMRQAGDEAEAQMAFYLRRAFGTDPDIHVFHDLRIEEDGDAAQIDHLVLHRHGAIVVESKSVTSAVRINDREEWARQWNGHWTGMPSPVLQARRQADFLRAYLRARREPLLDRAMFGLVQRGFGMFPFGVVVAISDRGVIQTRTALPDVRKADQVVDRVRELIRDQAGLAQLTSRDPRARDWGMTLKPAEFARTSEALLAAHRDAHSAPASVRAAPPARTTAPHAPRPAPQPVYEAVGMTGRHAVRVEAPAAPLSERPRRARFTCQKCSGANLEVVYGKYGYYFKCRDCDANTRIDLTCSACGQKARTRKARQDFHADCTACNHTELYYTNPA